MFGEFNLFEDIAKKTKLTIDEVEAINEAEKN